MAITYRPLDASKREFRLLEIQPAGSISDPVYCRIVTARLTEKEKPDYIALSSLYSDDTPDTDRIIVMLELFADLNRRGRTVVAVLHDLAQAARFASRLVVMDAGRVVADGPPGEVLTADLVHRVFGLRCDVVPDPRTSTPLVIPHERRR